MGEKTKFGQFLQRNEGGLVGEAFGMLNSLFQRGNQKYLMGVQHRNAMAQNQQMHDLAYDMWNKTNYQAQVGKMKEAGLNPALMYGGSGAGGQTMGSAGSGGGAGLGQAQSVAPMDVSNMMLARAEADLKRAQTKDLQSQTQERDEWKRANITASTQEILQGIKESKVRTDYLAEQKRGQWLANRITEASSQSQILHYYEDYLKTQAEKRLLLIRGGIEEATADEQIAQAGLETLGKALDNTLKQANINLTNSQTANTIKDTEKKAVEMVTMLRNTEVGERQAKVAEVNNWLEQRKQDLTKVMNDDNIKKDKQIEVMRSLTKILTTFMSSVTWIATTKMSGEKGQETQLMVEELKNDLKLNK